MNFSDRYSTAVRSTNLKSRPETTHSDTDTLGAAGLAGKRQPLAMALMRLFVGDNGMTSQIVYILADMAWSRAHHQGLKLRRVQAEDMAAKVLAWHRDGVCKPCGGHGVHLQSGGRIGEGRGALSDRQCGACRGTGRVPFDREFGDDARPVAQWLLAEVERETAKAGPAAMAALAPRLDF